jgi:hypothetical protein
MIPQSNGSTSTIIVSFCLMIENDVESCDTDLLEGLQNLKCFIESI